MYVVITSDLRTGDLLPEEWPGVLHPDAVVDELDVVDDDPHEGLLPLYGGQDRPVLAVQDDPVALDTLGNCRSEGDQSERTIIRNTYRAPREAV